MRRTMIGFIAIVLLLLVGCGGSGGGTLAVAYNSVYGVNALSTDENISLYVGDEVISPVMPYDENASIIAKAVGGNNIASYTVTGGSELGQTSLQNSRTYFYAATDCNVNTDAALYHMVENDTQINIVNTASIAISASDVNITLQSGGVGIYVDSATDACSIRVLPVNSLQGDTITVSFAGTSYSYQISAQASIDIVIYDIAAENAAIIPLPRLTPDAL